MRELALFAGIGGSTLAGLLAGWRTVGAVEIDPYCREILLRRQEEAIIEPFPVWDDIRTFDGRPWRGVVDLITGGFPCQPFSTAGKQLEEMDHRCLWPEMRRVISCCGPTLVFAENVMGSKSYTERVVWPDLRSLGYRIESTPLKACELGYMHQRERLWTLAYADGTRFPHAMRCAGSPWSQGVPLVDSCYRRGLRIPGHDLVESGMGRTVPRLPRHVDQIRGLGNAWIPDVAATAFKLLMRRLGGAQ